MIRIWKILALLSLASLPLAHGETPPPDTSQIRSKIDLALQGRHTEQSAQWWHELGEGAPGVITSMYESEPRTHRKLRLLAALGFYDDKAGVEFLKQEAKSTSNSVVRQTAVRALVQSQGMKESAFLTGFLHHSDAQTRTATAIALRHLGDDAAQQMVDEYLKGESQAWIVAKVNAASHPKPKTLLEPKPIE